MNGPLDWLLANYDVALTPGVSFLLHLAAVLAPLAVVARFTGSYPHRPMLFLIGFPAVLSLSLLNNEAAVWWILGLDLLVAVVILADWCTLPRKRAFGVERRTGRIASLDKDHAVELTVVNRSRWRRFVWLRDDQPTDISAEPDEFRLLLGPLSRSSVDYRLRASRRGAFQLARVYLRVRSALGLWQRTVDYPALSTIHVYPDMKQLAEYAVLARTNRLNLMGLRRTRRIGQDNEFERLRDYTLDDNFKHIDWRSTARRGKLTVKDFQANQSQRLIFMIDCGRMMTNEAAGLSLLDHAFNAMLMLAYVALSRGDSVGLVCFSDEIHAFVPPRSGMNQMNRLLHACFDQFPRFVESRYDEAFLYLASHCRKRSLVALVTNVIDDVNSRQIEDYLGNIAGKHLPLGVLLRDRRLFEAVEADDPQGEALYAAAAAADVLTWRRQVIADMESRGVLSLDVFPDNLTAPLVNRYLEIKARHLL